MFEVGLAPIAVVGDQAYRQRRRQVAIGRRTATDANPGHGQTFQYVAQTLLHCLQVGRARRVQDQQIDRREPLAIRCLLGTTAQAGKFDALLLRPGSETRMLTGQHEVAAEHAYLCRLGSGLQAPAQAAEQKDQAAHQNVATRPT